MEEVRGFDLTPVQFAALDAICIEPGMDQIGLSGATALDRTTIAGVVERLETKGLIDRKMGAHDRRTRTLWITDAGRRVLDDIAPSVLRAQERILGPLKPQERDVFMTLLSQVVDENNPFSRSPVKKRSLRAKGKRNSTSPE